METTNNKKDIFKIAKDPEKQEFIDNHTYNNISFFAPGENSLIDSIIKNNLQYLKNENEKINQNKEKQNIDKNINEKLNENNNMIKIKVILNYSYQKDFFEFCLPVKIMYNDITHFYQFCLNEIIDTIHDYINNKSIFLNENYGISYYTNDDNYINEQNKTVNTGINMNIDEENANENDIQQYFFIGNYPLNENVNYCINIPLDGVLHLKFRKKISKIKSLRYDIFEEENEEEIEEYEENNVKNEEKNEKNEEIHGDNNKQNKGKDQNYNIKSKRAKEKRIGYIVKKVFEWKYLIKLTGGKMSLIEAASKVGLSKKTLDEYYNQIKEGKKYNFDFNKHKKDKVNVLRGYVKKMNDPKNKKLLTKSN